MAQIPLNIKINPSYSGTTIGYTILNIDRTIYSAFSTLNIVDLGGGEFAVTNGITVPDAGGYVTIYESDGTTFITEANFDATLSANLAVPGMPGVTPGNPVPGLDFTLMRGDTTGFAIENLDVQIGDVFEFTAKFANDVDKWYDMVDDEASIFVSPLGLMTLNGVDVSGSREAEATMIQDDVQGIVFITFQPSASYEFIPSKYVYDLQRIRGADVQTVAWGMLEILADVTRRIS